MKMPRSISPLNQDSIKNRITSMVDERERLIRTREVENLHIRVSEGNEKMGNIISISLIPIADCGNCKCCKALCYDVRTDCMRKNVCSSRSVNSAILKHDPKRFWTEWRGAIYYYTSFRGATAVRYHVGGDIKDAQYFAEIIETCKQFPNIDFLIFTKMFDIVNNWIDVNGFLPTNLKLLFSEWPGQETPNPHNLPTTQPIFTDKTIQKLGYKDNSMELAGSYYCSGNCTACKAGCKSYFDKKYWHGCWDLKPGERVVFPAH